VSDKGERNRTERGRLVSLKVRGWGVWGKKRIEPRKKYVLKNNVSDCEISLTEEKRLVYMMSELRYDRKGLGGMSISRPLGDLFRGTATPNLQRKKKDPASLKKTRTFGSLQQFKSLGRTTSGKVKRGRLLEEGGIDQTRGVRKVIRLFSVEILAVASKLSTTLERRGPLGGETGGGGAT